MISWGQTIYRHLRVEYRSENKSRQVLVSEKSTLRLMRARLSHASTIRSFVPWRTGIEVVGTGHTLISIS